MNDTMMSLSEAAAVLETELIGTDTEFTAVSTDTRSLRDGDLFVALKGDNFDGSQFLDQARAKGAVAAVVNDSPALRNKDTDLPLLIVNDTRLALGKLASYWRDQFTFPVVAITGSNGKTTVKDMLASILSHACFPFRDVVLATQGNLNNDIGVPLTLLKLRAGQQYAVIEMGMNHPGEISYLTRLTKPNVALINNAGAAHLEGLGSVEAVAKAKGEIFEGLADDGIAVINEDDFFADFWKSLVKDKRITEFSLEGNQAAVNANVTLTEVGSELIIHTSSVEISIHLSVPGLHNARNAVAAAAIALELQVDPIAIAAGLTAFRGVKGRLQQKKGRHGEILIDDTYNANPDSTYAALGVLAAANRKKIFVLGDMGELGDRGRELHAEIGKQVKKAGVDYLFTLGDLSAAASESFGQSAQHFSRIEDLLAAVEPLLSSDVSVLIKGSRFMQMERVVKALEQPGVTTELMEE